MPVYKPSELQAFLHSLGIAPKKILSQNFLIDGNIIRKIVELSGVEAGDTVLEIGPGPGALTEALLDRGAHVIAVEKDRVLAGALERLKADGRQLEVFCEDILLFPIKETLQKAGKGKVKVIANLPYHITTPILAYLVQQYPLFSQIVVMVQEEVARRFVAAPDTSEYSSFTLFLNFFSAPKLLFPVSRHCFYPPPKVESAVVKLTPKEPPKVLDQDAFFVLTRTAFNHRRKMLRASLKELYAPEVVMQALEQIQIDPLARPERLGLDDWLRFFEQLHQKV